MEEVKPDPELTMGRGLFTIDMLICQPLRDLLFTEAQNERDGFGRVKGTSW